MLFRVFSGSGVLFCMLKLSWCRVEVGVIRWLVFSENGSRLCGL